MTICDRCKQRVKDWEGDDPKCGFEWVSYHDQPAPIVAFTPKNWNCASLNALRDVAKQNGFVNESLGGDEYIAIIPSEEGHGIVMSWYKNRGRVNYAYLHNPGDASMLRLTPARVEECLSLYGESA